MLCDCDSALVNTGATLCQVISNVTKKLILVPLRDKDGNYNEIDLVADLVNGILPDTFVQAKINEDDPFKRWYPTPGSFENYAGEVADPVTKEYDGGRIQKIREGAESFSAMLVGYERAFMDKLNAIGCTKFGVFVITKSGNLEGTLVGDIQTGKLRPTAVYEGSWNVKPMPSNETDSLGEAMVTFTFDVLEEIKDRKMLQAQYIETNMLQVEGLIEVLGKVTTNTATEFKLDAPTCFGSAGHPVLAEGITAGDLSLSAGTVSSVVEEADGSYTVTHDAPASTNVTLTLDKDGYSMSPITFANPA